MISTTLQAGELVYHQMPGAGGWGNPLDRPAEEVAQDVRDDKVSLEGARELYGVVLDAVTFEIDHELTAELRSR